MAAFGTGASRQLQGRGGSPGFRFTLYALLSIVIMFLDERSHWLESARYVLQAAAYPFQLAVSSPSAAWAWMQESFETRDALRSENNRLRAQQRAMEIRSMRFEALQKENAELRGLRDALPPVADHWLPAEVVNVQLDNFRQRLLLNRGTRNGVFKGQAVLDEQGLLGQTLHVGPWSAEVILITDQEHELPVQIERNGVRTIAVGAGDKTSLALSLPYLPANADVKIGDLLLTSGMGGVFPAGYPVARVTEVHHDAVQPLAQVRAAPLARIDIDREAMLVWFRPDHPAAPGTETMTDTRAGNAKMHPLPAPPHAASAAGTGAEAGTAETSASPAKAAASEPKAKSAAPHASQPASAAPSAAKTSPESSTSTPARTKASPEASTSPTRAKASSASATVAPSADATGETPSTPAAPRRSRSAPEATTDTAASPEPTPATPSPSVSPSAPATASTPASPAATTPASPATTPPAPPAATPPAQPATTSPPEQQ